MNTTPNDPMNDPALKALLHDTASGITPQGTFEEIKERTMTEKKARWILPAGVAAAVMALVIGGVGWMLHDNDSDASPDPAVSPTADASGTPSPVEHDVTTKDVDVFYLGDTAAGPRLFSEKHKIQADGPGSFGFGAVGDAMQTDADDPDYTSAWATAGIVASSSTTDNPGMIDININKGTDLSRPAGMSQEVARLSLEQLVRSYDAGAGEPIKLRFFWSRKTGDGGTTTTDEQIMSIFGIDTSTPLGTSPDDEVMAPMQITSLTEGQKVPAGKLTVSGLAASFEGNVQWQIEDTVGKVLQHDFTTAAECCTLSPYSFEVDLTPGSYVIVVHDTDESGEDRPNNQDTKQIVVG